jgi:endo-1,4-beta-xylanase
MADFSRRALLASTVAAAATAAGRGLCAQEAGPAVPAPAAAAAPPPSPGLNAHARPKGLFYGCAVASEPLAKDPALMDRVYAEGGIVVSENAFKWLDIHPTAEKFDFAGADALVAWAGAHRMAARGHTLVWHESNPDWLEPALNPGTAEKILRNHIKTVVGRYAGKLVHWDVVNEPIHEEDQKPFALRDTVWHKALGPAYLDIAFHATQAADPGALRVINEFAVDYEIDWQIRKREQLLALCADLLRRKVPLQAVGLQAHLDAGEIALDQNSLARFVADIASLGLKVIVTELDVRDQRLPASIPARDAAVAAHARAWLDAVLPNPAVLGVLTWGLSDRGSWLNDKFARPDGLKQRGLPLDEDLKRKKMWTALAGSFDAAPPRSTMRG